MDASPGCESELGEGRVRVNKLIDFAEPGSHQLMDVYQYPLAK
jgi:hypothetical protein